MTVINLHFDLTLLKSFVNPTSILLFYIINYDYSYSLHVLINAHSITPYIPEIRHTISSNYPEMASLLYRPLDFAIVIVLASFLAIGLTIGKPGLQLDIQASLALSY